MPGSRGSQAIAPTPGIDRIAHAALNAATDPLTWVPVVGAALLQINDSDQKISSWAIERTPVFGSHDRAQNASDGFLVASFAEALTSSFATPGGADSSDWREYKLRGLEVEGFGMAVAYGFTELGKRTLRRQRPDAIDYLSFPSGHAVGSFYAATVTSKILDSISMPGVLRFGLQAGAYTTAAASAWGRVEAGKHFPADVLVGAAIGHFFAAFFHDAFLGLPLEDRFGLDVKLSRHEAGILFRFAF